MASNFIDIFSDDAFSITSLTDAVSKIDHVPGQAGALTFAGNSVGIPTTSVVLEYKDTAINIVPFSVRGGPAPQESRDKAHAFKIAVPHVVLQETIGAESVQDVRAFGTTELQSVETVVNTQMAKCAARFDMTLEHMRLGALRGSICDADGSEVVNLFDSFNVAEPTAAAFTSSAGTLRPDVMAVKRGIEARAKILLPPGAQVTALCSPGFFDKLTGHPDVTVAFANWEAAQANLAGDVRKGFVFGDVEWIEYRGSDEAYTEAPSSEEIVSQKQVAIADGDCRFFLTGVPGLYTEKFAPGDYLDTVNSIGLPRYARIAIDPTFSKWVKLEVQSNPMPICLRPETLVRGHF